MHIYPSFLFKVPLVSPSRLKSDRTIFFFLFLIDRRRCEACSAAPHLVNIAQTALFLFVWIEERGYMLWILVTAAIAAVPNLHTAQVRQGQSRAYIAEQNIQHTSMIQQYLLPLPLPYKLGGGVLHDILQYQRYVMRRYGDMCSGSIVYDKLEEYIQASNVMFIILADEVWREEYQRRDILQRYRGLEVEEKVWREPDYLSASLHYCLNDGQQGACAPSTHVVVGSNPFLCLDV